MRISSKEKLKNYTLLLITGLMILEVLALTHSTNNREQFKVYAQIESEAQLNFIKIQDKKVEQREYMDSLPYFDTEVTEEVYPNNDGIESYLRSKFPTSPLIGKTGLFYKQGYKKGFTDKEIELLIAISGTESGFGTNAWHHNYWGIMCYRDGKMSTDCGWNDDEYAIGRAYDLVGSYLKKWNGENTQEVFIGSYCQSGCTTWVSSTEYFYNIIAGE